MSRALGALLLFAALAGDLFLGCSSNDDTSPAPHRASSSTKSGDDDDSAPVDAGTTPVGPVSAIDAGNGAAATTFVGTLDTTATTRFGGSPYCFYDVAYKNVDIEVTALPNGQIIGASVRTTAVEVSVKPCSQEGAPPSDHVYSYTTDTELPDGRDQLAFSSAPANHPQAALIVNLTKTGGSYKAEAQWHRTDQPPPLDYTIKTTITLGPK